MLNLWLQSPSTVSLEPKKSRMAHHKILSKLKGEEIHNIYLSWIISEQLQISLLRKAIDNFIPKKITLNNQGSLAIAIRVKSVFVIFRLFCCLKEKDWTNGILKKYCVHVAFWAINLILMDTSFLSVALWVRCEDHVHTSGKWCDSDVVTQGSQVWVWGHI